ncbi:hypothetical protein [Streptomyces griseorubiginosus]|uniref:hypothetical protein n=1 Tax=Streptomyces griseorubiginosus TaxID=67304 RepID=UPI0036E7C368
MTPVDFYDLPIEVRRTVEAQAGTAKKSRPDKTRYGCDIAVHLDTEHGPVLVKAARHDSPMAPLLTQEAVVSPYLPVCVPQLLWRVESAGWLLTGYDDVQGERADFQDSDDLIYVLDALMEVWAVTTPEVGHASGHPEEIDRAGQRWSRFADEGTAHLLSGNTLLHTDIGPHTTLSGFRGHIVDWVRPARGAAFIDPYIMALRMVEAGHWPHVTLSWIRRLPSWREAPRQARLVFADVMVRYWEHDAEKDPHPGAQAMARHAADLRDFLKKTPWA